MTISPQLPLGERIYAIGDVHGHADLLAHLLDAIRLDNDARPASRVTIILVGDLIDRGPSSASLVTSCLELTRAHDRFIVLKGNHEAVMVDALNGSVPAFAFWLGQGGNAALTSWGVPATLTAAGPSRELMTAAEAKVPHEVVAWLAGLPLYHQRGNCLFVHAGIRPGVRLAKQKMVDLLWIRGDFTKDKDPLPYLVVHGHTIDETGPCLQHGRLGIDTGAYRTGRLTAVGIESGEHWSLSTSSKLVFPGPLPTIEESVAAILGNRGERSPPAARRTIRMHTLAAVCTAVAALLLLGTITMIQARRDDPVAVSATLAGTTPLRPTTEKTSLGSYAASNMPASPRPPAVATEEFKTASVEPPNGDGDAALRIGKTSYKPLGTAIPISSLRRSSDRAQTTQSTGGDFDVRASRSTFASAPAAAPVSVISLAQVDGFVAATAIAVRRSDRAPPLTDLAPSAASTLPTFQAESAKKRMQAIDAIRLLRRQ